MPNTKRPVEVEGRIECQFESCNRTFSRHEHLQPHALNHADGDYTCTRCRAHFKRPDLLDRHMTRHRQKDAEGSELMTRKRAWKDSEGRIVKKRPTIDSNGDISTNEASQRTTSTPPLPISPPRSASSNLTASPKQPFESLQNDSDDLQNLNFEANTIQPYAFEDPNGQDLFWEGLPFLPDSGNSAGPFDDIFMPDTASSFNMPYTTVTNYNWLFDLSLDTNLCSDPSLGNLSDEQPPAPCQRDQVGQVQSNIHQQSHEIRVEESQGQVCEKGTYCSHQRNSRMLPTETPMCYLDPNKQLPMLDETTHRRLLGVIESCRPAFPDGTPIALNHQLLSCTSLQLYLGLFFTRFNTTYPLIHLPTFDPASEEPILLLSAILLGATYADKESYQIAVCIHDVLRPFIFSCPGFSARAELPILQAILLTECLGKSRAGQRQHDMSHLFHGLLINLIRRSECQTASPELIIEAEAEDDVDLQWRKWADLESKKRLAQICFIWDVQHAVLFSQSLCMSAFELRTSLPCDQAMWEAETSQAWKASWTSKKQTFINLLAVLRSYLNPNRENLGRDLNAISRAVIFHGLMSVSWDMERRDQTSLGLLSNGIVSGPWRERMAQSYDDWKSDFDQYTSNMKAEFMQMPNDPISRKELGWRQGLETYEITGNAIFHAAGLALLADIVDLQIYGGARHILGRSVSKIDYARSQKIVKRWATEDVERASRAAWHSACLLKDASESKECSFISVDVFHHPWTVFLASLTLWAFHQARPMSSTDQDDEMIWDASQHMKQLLDVIVRHGRNDTQLATSHLGKNCTAGLNAVVVGHLSKIRWAIVHDGMMVLKGLVPWRLVCEDDSRK